ncbi:hypothetical protein AVEN_51682-1 [Araneus ventricosus]|uniref:Uncharacterized protein n=1 Tax=Araneus ventricosus TaxID=182803 RepID=A0A4Y2UMQ1_ARAVE|nr:hypothetical protein AVEN_51682-1 [Araneus ventricosus]
MPNLGCRRVASDFPLELSLQFLSFASSMGIVMQEDDTITQHARRLRRITSRWRNDYFLFPKLKEHLSGTRRSSESDMKTVVNRTGSMGREVISAKPG